MISYIRDAGFTIMITLMAIGCSLGGTSIISETTWETPRSDAVVVTFTESGFSPRRLEIRAGQQVEFLNKAQVAFWPASNIHPTHEILPALDSGNPVYPGEIWSFIFDTPGYWRYHNHLSAQDSGLVVVANDGIILTPEPLVVHVDNLTFPEPRTMTPKDMIDLFKNDDTLKSFVAEYGPANTVKFVAEAGNRVGELCHERAHQTGRYAYEQFGAAAFGLSGHECEAGAFHGATEALFKERGTINLESDVRAICNTTEIYFFKLNCMHGVGHGLMAWTSYELYDSLELCNVLPEDRHRRACYSGVFMENVVGGLSGSMGHHTDYISNDDPHYPCNALEDKYVGPCYLYHSTRMLLMFDYDYDRTAKECTRAPISGKRDCFESFGRDVAAISLGDPESGIELCHNTLSDTLYRMWCIQGSVQARFWQPERADEALTMCKLLDDRDEKDGCYWMIITRANELYPDNDQFDAFCARVEDPYLIWCAR